MRLRLVHRSDRGRQDGRRVVFALALLVMAEGCSDGGPKPPPGAFFFADRVHEASVDVDTDRLRAFLKVPRLTDAMKLGTDTRRSIVAPPPSRFVFDATLPSAPILRVGIGVLALGDESRHPVRFRLRLRSGGDELVLLEETVRRRNLWIDRAIDLDRWAGSDVSLSFETESAGEVSDPDALRQILPLWGNPILTASKGPASRPHLLLISIDCLRADHVGAYGYEKPTTPHIDRLAQEAVVFERAVSTSSWTLPTHMSMLTGLLPSYHGVVSLDRRLDGGVRFLPERLHEAGYETLGLVSWLFVSQTYGFDRGFDLYRLRNLSPASDVVEDALGLLRSSAGHEQFLFLHLLDPHWRYDPPDELLERFGSRPADVSRLLELVAEGGAPEAASDVDEIVRLYDAEIAYVDRELGRLFEELKALGIYDSSLIIVTSDHGEAFYEHGVWQHGDTLYEEVLHVPLVVKWPGGTPHGRIAQPVSLTSVFSTLLEEAGVRAPEGSPAVLRGYVPGEILESSDGTIVAELSSAPLGRRGTWPPPGTSMMVSLRQGELKYIATLGEPSPADGAAPEVIAEEIYDLREDPKEQRNLADSLPREATAFRRMLFRYLRDAARAERRLSPPEVHHDEDTRRLLESLGYVTK